MFKIYVGNLDPRVKIEHVRELFSPFAVIEDAVLATDAKTGKAKGFAIVMIRDAEIGRAAVKATQGKRLMGKTLTINEVVKKGKGPAVPAPAVRQGPFGPHFNKQGGGRFGGGAGGNRGGGMARRGMNRGLRGPTTGARPPFGSTPGPASGSDRLGGPSFRAPIDSPPSRPPSAGTGPLGRAPGDDPTQGRSSRPTPPTAGE